PQQDAQQTPALADELASLHQQLRQERLFVCCEKDLIRQLFDQLSDASRRILHEGFRLHLQQRLLTREAATASAATGCVDLARFAAALDAELRYRDAYSLLTCHEHKYADLLRLLRTSPDLLAHVLLTVERRPLADTDCTNDPPGSGGCLPRLLQCVFACLFGHCLAESSEEACYQTLMRLMEIQVLPLDNPVKLLSRGTATFVRLLRLSLDAGAGGFLVQTLRRPIHTLLAEFNDVFLDLDLNKAVQDRFCRDRREHMFGKEGSEQFELCVRDYRKQMADRVARLARLFIDELRENTRAFPRPFLWLLSGLYRQASGRPNSRMSPAAARSLCGHLVFQHYLIPALLDPEHSGIVCSVAINYIQRNNLMQMGQVLEALCQGGSLDSRVFSPEIFGQFEPDCLTGWLDSLLRIGAGLSGPVAGLQPQQQHQQLQLSSLAVTPDDLDLLVRACRVAVGSGQQDDGAGAAAAASAAASQQRRRLEACLADLPESVPGRSAANATGSFSTGAAASPAHNVGSASSTPRAEAALSHSPASSSSPFVHRRRQVTSLLGNFGSGGGGIGAHSPLTGSTESLCAPDSGQEMIRQSRDVLVLQLDPPADCPGLLPEDRVLEKASKRARVSIFAPEESSYTRGGGGGGSGGSGGNEKKTRFSLSGLGGGDSEAGGSTSGSHQGGGAGGGGGGGGGGSGGDCLEIVSETAISEVASTHSAPSVEMDEEDESLVSANVSGRGTPSISGRDSPLDALPDGSSGKDVTERFNKFDIPPPQRDMSPVERPDDQWSTSVIDSEGDRDATARDLMLDTDDKFSIEVPASEADDKYSERLGEDFDETASNCSSSVSAAKVGAAAAAAANAAAAAANRRRSQDDHAGPVEAAAAGIGASDTGSEPGGGTGGAIGSGGGRPSRPAGPAGKLKKPLAKKTLLNAAAKSGGIVGGGGGSSGAVESESAASPAVTASPAAATPLSAADLVFTKYKTARRPPAGPATASAAAANNSTGSPAPAAAADAEDAADGATGAESSQAEDGTAAPPFFDPSNPEDSPAFAEAKRRLRSALTSSEFRLLPPGGFDSGSASGGVADLLRRQLAEAAELGLDQLAAALADLLAVLARSTRTP
ncbi:hypothetical protein BOX15_Mlig011836g2, partial [Macrostomum lignano]